jgi:hypothetical protein
VAGQTYLWGVGAIRETGEIMIKDLGNPGNIISHHQSLLGEALANAGYFFDTSSGSKMVPSQFPDQPGRLEFNFTVYINEYKP